MKTGEAPARPGRRSVRPGRRSTEDLHRRRCAGRSAPSWASWCPSSVWPPRPTWLISRPASAAQARPERRRRHRPPAPAAGPAAGASRPAKPPPPSARPEGGTGGQGHHSSGQSGAPAGQGGHQGGQGDEGGQGDQADADPSTRRPDLANRRRLDAELVRRGLRPSREQAQEAIDAGSVLVGGVVADKAARLVAAGDPIVISRPPRPLRGPGGREAGRRPRPLRIDVAGRRALDAGASTGGFTDCLLQAGAAPVVAVDVGRGQLHERLRADRGSGCSSGPTSGP